MDQPEFAFNFGSRTKKPKLRKCASSPEDDLRELDAAKDWELPMTTSPNERIVGRARIKSGYDIPKTLLSNEDLESVRRQLTAAPRKSDYSPTPTVPYELFRETAHAISVPRQFGISRWGMPQRDESDDGAMLDAAACVFVGKLRTTPPQVEAVDAIVGKLDTGGCASALLQFPCGYGKTTCAAAVISRVRRRTLVLVGRTCLLTQWEERIRQFLPDLTVGTWQGNKAPAGEDVVIAMIQTLESRKPKIEGYGLVVLDEAHHVAARTWATVQRLTTARRQLALTATLRRGDGLGHVLRYLLGPPTFSARRPPDNSVSVRRVMVPTHGRREIVQQGRVAMAQMINQLAACAPRSHLIADAVASARNQGHHVIVLSDRIAQLTAVHEYLTSRGVRSALLTGATKTTERDAALKERVVLASYGLAAEGLDEPSLSALVLATPRGDVEQSVGRILRLHPDKLPPLVVDFVDDYSVFAAQAEARARHYKQFGYSMTSVRV